MLHNGFSTLPALFHIFSLRHVGKYLRLRQAPPTSHPQPAGLNEGAGENRRRQEVRDQEREFARGVWSSGPETSPNGRGAGTGVGRTFGGVASIQGMVEKGFAVFATTLTAAECLNNYLSTPRVSPIFVVGDALDVLREFPSDVFDCCMTSPPYWGKREYANSGIGLETDYRDFIGNLSAICAEVKRVLKPVGSFWLNMGDSYAGKNLVGIPWRLAIELTDGQGWTLRNSVVWNKVKGGPDNARDRLRNVHEQVFHFVKSSKGYYYDTDSIRSTPKKAKVVNGSVVSATGVHGVRYRRQIELSSDLTDVEKGNAFHTLERMLASVHAGAIADFRMIIRGQQRTTHSNSEKFPDEPGNSGTRGSIS